MHFEIAFVMLFAVATAVALLARRFKLPYTIALVAAGLLLGPTDTFEVPHLTKELLYAVFLPGLLFEAAFHLELKKFLNNKLAIHALAVPGVVAAILLTAAILTPMATELELEAGFRFVDGLVFGAIIAATDPIAVVALFKSLGAPKRLAVLIEGESLLNDGTAVVLFGIILASATGAAFSPSSAVLEFVRVVGIGLAVGGGLGYVCSRVIQNVDEPMIEITLTTIAAYGSFVFAEHFHASGVMATVAAGMLCGNYAARTGMSPSTRIAAETFWEYLAFALNSIVFLLIGFEVSLDMLIGSAVPIVLAFAAVMAARAVVVAVVATLLSPTKERVPLKWAAVLHWGGLRGGLSMVLVLSLPATFPHREFLVTLTFGVVVLSIFLQGLTMTPLMRRLGLTTRQQEHDEYERLRGELLAARAALEDLSTMTSQGVRADVVERLRSEYQERAGRAERAITALHLEHAALEAEEVVRARRHLLLVEKDRVLQALRDGTIGSDAAAPLLADVDARLLRLEEGPDEGAPPSAGEAPARAKETT